MFNVSIVRIKYTRSTIGYSEDMHRERGDNRKVNRHLVWSAKNLLNRHHYSSSIKNRKLLLPDNTLTIIMEPTLTQERPGIRLNNDVRSDFIGLAGFAK